MYQSILLCSVELGIPGVDILQADVSDVPSLEAMCSSTKVVINCVGPVSDDTHTHTHTHTHTLHLKVVNFLLSSPPPASISCMESLW